MGMTSTSSPWRWWCAFWCNIFSDSWGNILLFRFQRNRTSNRWANTAPSAAEKLPAPRDCILFMTATRLSLSSHISSLAESGRSGQRIFRTSAVGPGKGEACLYIMTLTPGWFICAPDQIHTAPNLRQEPCESLIALLFFRDKNVFVNVPAADSTG